VSTYLALGEVVDKPGIGVLPFFALTAGLLRLVWIVRPFVEPTFSHATGNLVWARDERVREPAAGT
jgi:hypothetical protein